jgi:DNA transformation protein
MAVSQAFTEYVLDQLGGAWEVVAKRMFGGVGLYLEGLFCALIADDVLYLKVDEHNRADFEARGMEPFRPTPHRPTVMSYYAVPADVLEDPELLAAWAGRAREAAARQVARADRGL